MGALNEDMSPLSHFLFLFPGNKVSGFGSGICMLSAGYAASTKATELD